jgi:hypothetical protein
MCCTLSQKARPLKGCRHFRTHTFTKIIDDYNRRKLSHQHQFYLLHLFEAVDFVPPDAAGKTAMVTAGLDSGTPFLLPQRTESARQKPQIASFTEPPTTEPTFKGCENLKTGCEPISFTIFAGQPHIVRLTSQRTRSFTSLPTTGYRMLYICTLFLIFVQ